MKPSESERLLRLAGRIADGDGVDWGLEESETRDPGEAPLLRRLRVLEGFARFHRLGQSSSGDLSLTDFVPKPPAPQRLSRWGDLEVIEKIGEGSFAEVFRVRDTKLEREVALKLLKSGQQGPGAEMVAVREARLFARIRHPNVATVFGADVREGRAGFWMEFVRGRDIESLLRERGAFGSREAALVGIEICRALAAVHGAGLVHRDVKGSNVMREEGGRILLMDFGCGADSKDLEERKNLAGTPLYQAPELLRGDEASPQSDLYSLGVLLFRLVTASYPVQAEDYRELLQAHAAGTTRSLRDIRPDLPPSYVKAVEKALSHDPRSRFRSVGEMEKSLAESLDASPTKARPGGHRTLFAGIGVASLAGALVLAWKFSAPETRTEALSSEGGSPEKVLEAKLPGPVAETPAKPSPAPPMTAESVRVSLRLQSDGGESDVVSGSRVRPGSRLSMEIVLSEPLHFYVISEDGEGRVYQLFPDPRESAKNPLPSEPAIRIPETAWRAMDSKQREYLLIAASREPLAAFEGDLRRFGGVKNLRLLEREPLSDETRLRRMEGDAAVSEDAKDPFEGSLYRRLTDAALGAPQQTGVIEGIWFRRIDLESPLR